MVLHIDGSCQGNGMPSARAGYAVVSEDGSVCSSGRLPGELQTNNRAEMLGLLKALELIDAQGFSGVLIKTDSKLLYDSLVGVAKRKANRDLWRGIEQLSKSLEGRFRVELISRENNMADAEAKKSANSLI